MTNDEMIKAVTDRYSVSEAIVREIIAAGSSAIPCGTVLGKTKNRTVEWMFLGVRVCNDDGTCEIHTDAQAVQGALMTYAANEALAAQSHKHSMGRIV